MDFAKTIKQLRIQNCLSQKDIAEYLGVTRQAIASYESAKREPDYTTLKKLADFFDVSVDFLLGRAAYKSVNSFTVLESIGPYNTDMNLSRWAEDKENLKYIKLAKKIQETGLPVSSVLSVIDVMESVGKEAK